MATLTGEQIASTYKDLLQVSNSNAGVDATLRDVEDGEATASCVKLSTTAVAITGDAYITSGLRIGDTTTAPDDNTIEIKERSSDPGNPAEGNGVIWLSDGTEQGDDGDLIFERTAGAATVASVLNIANSDGQLEADEVLVATSITDGHVLTADGANGLAWEAAAGGDAVDDEDSATATSNINTSSTSLVNMTDMSVTITASAACKVLLLFHGSVFNNTAGKSVFVRFYDGATGLGSEFEVQTMLVACNMTAAPLHYFGDLTEGEHTFTLKWRTVSGGAAYTSYSASERRLTAVALTG